MCKTGYIACPIQVLIVVEMVSFIHLYWPGRDVQQLRVKALLLLGYNLYSFVLQGTDNLNDDALSHSCQMPDHSLSW